ncbi:MAG TPA: A24 family peptidase [Tepidisphaeraceae bacterium]|nr:A24 family peptidase [Tepidisphaeraceae bacterium]
MHLVLLMFPLLAMLAVAAVIDFRSRRIPNWLTIVIAVTGLLQAASWSHSVAGGWMSIVGLAVGLAINLPLFALGLRGGGDVKLFAGVGAWLGPVNVVAVFIVATVVAMLVAILQAIVTRRVSQVARNTASMAVGLIHPESRVDSTDQASYAARHVPYAVPILVAVIALVGLR